MRIQGTGPGIGLLLAALLFGLATHSSPAAACASSERSVFYVEYDEGSAALPGSIAERLRAQLLPSLSGQKYVASYYVLASGDVAEGAAWDSAPQAARAADHRLGEARSEALRSLLEAQPEPLRTGTIEVKVRDNRQLLTEAELRANPRLSPRTRAAIVADIRIREPEQFKGRPVPLC